MEKLPEEPILKSPEFRLAVAGDCLLMFRLQHLHGKELNLSDLEKVAKYEKYKDEFDPSKIQVILYQGMAVGRLRIVREDSIYIGGFQILPEYRARGIGTAVLSELIAESKQTGMPITLEVFNDNIEAIKLYERMDFVVTGEDSKQKTMTFEPNPVLASL